MFFVVRPPPVSTRLLQLARSQGPLARAAIACEAAYVQRPPSRRDPFSSKAMPLQPVDFQVLRTLSGAREGPKVDGLLDREDESGPLALRFSRPASRAFCMAVDFSNSGFRLKILSLRKCSAPAEVKLFTLPWPLK